MRPASELLHTAASALPGLQVEYLSFTHYGDRGGTLQVWGTVPQSLVYYPGVTLNAASGEVLAVSNWRQEHWARALYGAMTPLHYASYGGLLLKVLYALLGLASCFLVLSGLRIWQLRVHPHTSDVRLPLIDGVCYGLPLATALLLGASRVSGGVACATYATYATYEGRLTLFLLAWSLAIAGAFWFRDRRAGSALCLLTGTVLLGLPLATALGDRISLGELLQAQPTSPALVAELALSLLGVVTLSMAWVIRRRSPPHW
jgi:hypothetical protein